MEEQIAALEEQLAEIENRLERVERERLAGEQTNPAMDIGGIRSRSKRQKQQIFNRYTRQAATVVSLLKEKEQIERKLQLLRQKPEERKRKWQRDIAAIAWWDNLKPGDTFCPGGNPLVIRRKNRMSLITEGGTKWDITEVTGLSRARIKEIRAHTNKTNS